MPPFARMDAAIHQPGVAGILDSRGKPRGCNGICIAQRPRFPAHQGERGWYLRRVAERRLISVLFVDLVGSG